MMAYELTLALASDTTEAKKKRVLEKVKKLVELDKGKIEKTNDWGKIDLAYPIKKNSQGVFLHLALSASSGLVRDLDTKLNLEEDIIRYLLVRKD